MPFVGTIVGLLFVVLVIRLLNRKYHAQAVLLVGGLLMVYSAHLLGLGLPSIKQPTGLVVFDLFQLINELLTENLVGIGLMIMVIGGFVAYMKKIGASDALVYVSMKPLSVFKKYPYVLASLVIPVGQLLFITIPSATGLGLLLMASVFPVLTNLGISKTSSASVITACTVFDMGPCSANTARASVLMGETNLGYFVDHQLPLTVPLTLIMAVVYYFVNRFFDKKEKGLPPKSEHSNVPLTAPLIFAVLPVFPLALLVVFSKQFNYLPFSVDLNATTAVLCSLFIAIIFELIRNRKVKKVFHSLKVVWEAMGKCFHSVVLLIVAAQVFSAGLVSLGMIHDLAALSEYAGMGEIGIGMVMTVLVFLASILLGSGNASFFSFGPLVPEIATKMGINGMHMILPMQLASSLGRAVSPIAGIVIATAGIAGIAPYRLAKRNLIPLSIVLIVMLVYHFLW